MYGVSYSTEVDTLYAHAPLAENAENVWPWPCAHCVANECTTEVRRGTPQGVAHVPQLNAEAAIGEPDTDSEDEEKERGMDPRLPTDTGAVGAWQVTMDESVDRNMEKDMFLYSGFRTLLQALGRPCPGSFQCDVDLHVAIEEYDNSAVRKYWFQDELTVENVIDLHYIPYAGPVMCYDLISKFLQSRNPSKRRPHNGWQFDGADLAEMQTAMHELHTHMQSPLTAGPLGGTMWHPLVPEDSELGLHAPLQGSEMNPGECEWYQEAVQDPAYTDGHSGMRTSATTVGEGLRLWCAIESVKFIVAGAAQIDPTITWESFTLAWKTQARTGMVYAQRCAHRRCNCVVFRPYGYVHPQMRRFTGTWEQNIDHLDHHDTWNIPTTGTRLVWYDGRERNTYHKEGDRSPRDLSAGVVDTGICFSCKGPDRFVDRPICMHCEGDEIPANYTEDGVLATDRCTAPAQWMNIVPNTVCKDQPHLWTTGLSQDATKAAAGCGGAWAWSEYAYHAGQPGHPRSDQSGRGDSDLVF